MSTKRVFDLTRNDEPKKKKVQNPITGRMIDVGSAIFNKLRTHEGYTYDNEANAFSKRPNADCEDEVKELDSLPPSRKLAKTKVLLSIAMEPRKTEILSIVEAPTVLVANGIGDDFDTIAHLSDIHVPSNLHLSRRQEYEGAFEAVYDKLRSLAENRTLCIVITGDLVHSKLDVQNETSEVARNFVATLGQIAPTIVIIGNHDFLEQNKTRVDSLSVIVDRISNVFGLKTTGLYQLENLTFSFSSLFDNKFIPFSVAAAAVKEANAPIYALYHGTVHGSLNCNKRINATGGHGSFELFRMSDFEGYAGCLFGHIHLQQQMSDAPAAWYAGSLIQQNFGESIDGHGFLVWDLLEQRVIPCDIQSKYAMLNVKIDSGKLIPESECALKFYSNSEDENYKQLSLKCKCIRTSELQFKSLVQILTQTMPNVVSIKLANSLTPSLLKPGKDGDEQKQNESNEEEQETLIERERALLRKHTIFIGDVDKTTNLIEFHEFIVQQVYSSSPLVEPIGDKSIVQWTIESARFRNISRYGDDHINNVNFGADGGVFSISADNQFVVSCCLDCLVKLAGQTRHRKMTCCTTARKMGLLKLFSNAKVRHTR
jgi:DNA repair exonuclease SbcCD nuclease subunit